LLCSVNRQVRISDACEAMRLTEAAAGSCAFIRAAVTDGTSGSRLTAMPGGVFSSRRCSLTLVGGVFSFRRCALALVSGFFSPRRCALALVGGVFSPRECILMVVDRIFAYRKMCRTEADKIISLK
jgi:hypothetical protein